MLLDAARCLEIDMARSWAIGDSGRDLEAGRRAVHGDDVLETAIANVWLCRDGELWTPPAPARCLPGIVRGWLLEHTAALGLQVLECDFTEADLLGADELWISNAVGGVRRVASVAGREWRSWPVFEDLAKPAKGAPAAFEKRG